MNQDRVGRVTPTSPGRAVSRPALERPSLFAGMEDDSDTHREAAQRVAILSTLASGQRPPGPPPPGNAASALR